MFRILKQVLHQTLLFFAGVVAANNFSASSKENFSLEKYLFFRFVYFPNPISGLITFSQISSNKILSANSLVSFLHQTFQLFLKKI